MIDARVLAEARSRGSAFRPEEGMEVIATGKLTTYPGSLATTRSSSTTLEPAGVGALMTLLEERKQEARRRGAVRRGAQASAAVPARGDRRRDLADRRRDPRHPAPARRPLPAPRAGLAGARCRARRRRPRWRRRSRGFNALAGRRPGAAARCADRGARRRQPRGSLGLQRGDRGARRGRLAPSR